MEKYSLIKEALYHKFKEGDIIRFEMPSFTSGEYLAKVYKDEEYGFYINQEDNYFRGCRDWTAYNINDDDCMEWLKEEYKKL